MAKKARVTLDRSHKGKPVEEYIANLSGVQNVVHQRAKEIEATAEEILQPHVFSGATEVRTERISRRSSRIFAIGANGWVVSLIDTGKGYEGAIEYGRDDYKQERSDEAKLKGYRDAWTTRKVAQGVYKKTKVRRALDELYGGMDGLFILTKAVRATRARHRREFR